MKHHIINSKKINISLIVTLVLLCFCMSSFAQQKNNNNTNHNAQHKIEALKKAYIAHRLNLSPKEAEKFWPVYKQYQKDMRQLIRERRQNKANENNDKQAEPSPDEDLSLRQEALQLREQYRKRFKQAIPPRKVMQFYKSERDFNMKLVNELRRRRNRNALQHYRRLPGKRLHPLK